MAALGDHVLEHVAAVGKGGEDCHAELGELPSVEGSERPTTRAVCGLDTAEARAVTRWASEALVRQALLDARART